MNQDCANIVEDVMSLVANVSAANSSFVRTICTDPCFTQETVQELVVWADCNALDFLASTAQIAAGARALDDFFCAKQSTDSFCGEALFPSGLRILPQIAAEAGLGAAPAPTAVECEYLRSLGCCSRNMLVQSDNLQMVEGNVFPKILPLRAYLDACEIDWSTETACPVDYIGGASGGDGATATGGSDSTKSHKLSGGAAAAVSISGKLAADGSMKVDGWRRTSAAQLSVEQEVHENMD
eukprot:m.634772 g.634772  ORF g.634772 m.634772 type:complete len:239 (+) comp22581_c0_seq58:292-1008(+)